MIRTLCMIIVGIIFYFMIGSIVINVIHYMECSFIEHRFTKEALRNYLFSIVIWPIILIIALIKSLYKWIVYGIPNIIDRIIQNVKNKKK